LDVGKNLPKLVRDVELQLHAEAIGVALHELVVDPTGLIDPVVIGSRAVSCDDPERS
jgi:hypothetical protein